MIVVFDTNIWKSGLYLRSHTASAVKAYLQMHDAKVGLPEVVELEVKRHLLNDITLYRNRVVDDYGKLLALFGRLRELTLPTDGEIDELVQNTIHSVGLPIFRVPFDEAAARASFLRTIDKRRPSQKNQQFKDGVLWENCKSMAQGEPVILVTDDRAFYENDKVDQGLASELADELGELAGSLSVVSSLSALLEEIRISLEVDRDQLSRDIREQLGSKMDKLSENNGFSVNELREFDVRFFSTEEPSNLFAEIKCQYNCERIAEGQEMPGTMDLACDGSFNLSKGKFADLTPTSLSLTFVGAEGEEITRNHHFLRAGGIVIGHRTVDHNLRVPLD